MEIGVVVHGSGIVDSGWALEIINLLSKLGNVHCRLGGTMGRTAVIDAGLEDLIDISLKLLPSESLDLFNRGNMDVIFLLNYGKSAETGQTFGFNAFNHYFKKISNEDFLATNHKPLYDSKIPVIQIERPGEEDGSIISWNVSLNRKMDDGERVTIPSNELYDLEDDSDLMTLDHLVEQLSRILNLDIVNPIDIKSKYFSDNVNLRNQGLFEQFLEDYGGEDKDTFSFRKINGVNIGENIFINGHVVGTTNSNDLILVAKDKFLIDVIGGTLKDNASEKLGKITLDAVVVKTGLLRESDKVKPRVLSKDSKFLNEGEYISSNKDYYLKIGFVNYVAFDIYRLKDCDLVITIGDDTTLVASDILYRLDIPIFGIIEGNLDKVVKKPFVSEKSTIVEVPYGLDVLNDNIYKNLFDENISLTIPFESDVDDLGEFINNNLNRFKENLFEEIRNVCSTFNVKK